MKRYGYHIEDEPRPGTWSHLTVDPLWPFLATMLAGSWLSVPWFAVNGIAIGSATRRREILIAVGGVLAAALVWLVLARMEATKTLDDAYLKYVFLLIPGCKLTAAYFLHGWQGRSFELHTQFGGRHRNGVVVVIAGALMRGYVLKVFPAFIWMVVAS